MKVARASRKSMTLLSETSLSASSSLSATLPSNAPNMAHHLVLLCNAGVEFLIYYTTLSAAQSVQVYEYGNAPRASLRHARKARDRGVPCEYVAGSGTQPRTARDKRAWAAGAVD